MAKYDYITDEIINSIDYIVKERLKNASFDKTRTGRIIRLLDKNRYIVKIDDTEYEVPSISSDVLPLNAIVKVLVPENQYNNMFILAPGSQNGGGGGESGVTSVNGKTGNVIIGISDINGLSQQLANKLSNDSNLNSNIVTFTQAAIRSGINSGETLSVILGKIAKWYSDLSAVAFTGDYDDLTNAPEAVTKTSQLINDSSFISDSNYVHTDNNYTTTEKQKLSGLSNYVLPTASSNTLGGVKSGTDITVDNNGNVSVNNNSHNHTISNITDFPSIDNTPTQNSDNLVKSGGVKSALDDKISEPSSDGTSGQVLMTDGSGSRYWGTVSGGGGSGDSYTKTESDAKYALKEKYGDSTINVGRKANTTVGASSTAVGLNTTASGSYSYAEGSNTTASGSGAHAEGWLSTASAQYAHCEGYQTTASGLYSHAEGRLSTAQRRSQHVIGEYNILDTEGTLGSDKGKYISIIGNGTGTAERSNAHTVDWSGNGWFSGVIKIGGTGQDDTDAKELATKDYVDQAISTAINTYITAAINGSY